jgi:hypothetical protein
VRAVPDAFPTLFFTSTFHAIISFHLFGAYNDSNWAVVGVVVLGNLQAVPRISIHNYPSFFIIADASFSLHNSLSPSKRSPIPYCSPRAENELSNFSNFKPVLTQINQPIIKPIKKHIQKRKKFGHKHWRWRDSSHLHYFS